MKKLLALFLVLAMLLTACGQGAPAGESTPAETTPPETTVPETTAPVETEPVETEPEPIICETAQEFADNMTVGWNLGCSLSVWAKETLDGWGVMIYILTEDGTYSRSEVIPFDPETLASDITWKLGQDNGILQSAEGAPIDSIGIELWNFSKGDNHFLTYTLDELVYVMADGTEVSLDEALGEKSTDMGGGTGGGTVADLPDNPVIGEVVEIRAKVGYVEETLGEITMIDILSTEMAWGNNPTTPEMITAVRDRGFNTIRIQVSWLNHMDDYGNVEPLFMERVEEVVGYCMDAGVYCIIGTTGAGWLSAERDTFEAQSEIYRTLWTQIAERFKNHGELLLFESCNEVLTADGLWWNPPEEAYAVMNELYQIFVDTVRASGGNNATRNLVLNPYAATYDYNMNSYFQLPTDTVEDHLIAQVHCYYPNEYTMNETNLGHTDFREEWGSEEDKAELDAIMEGIKTRFIDELGIPVFIGEFGVVKRVEESKRAEYISYYVQAAQNNGIELIIFDDGGDFAVFNRVKQTWPAEQVIAALFQEEIPAEEPAE